MRKDFTPQVETREIDDCDLDNVSGGLGVLGIDTAGVVAPVLGTVEGALPVTGTVLNLLPAQVTGLAGL
jgi:hypothetical protein